MQPTNEPWIHTENSAPGRRHNEDERRRIHAVHEAPPSPIFDTRNIREVAADELAVHSPDGRPADLTAQKKGKTAFFILLAVGLPLVIFAVYYFGGKTGLIMSVVYGAVLALAAFPFWYSGYLRNREEKDAEHLIEEEITTKTPQLDPPAAMPSRSTGTPT